jgi:hypothetical protein
MGQRRLETMLRRSSGKRVSDALDRLVKGRWLRRLKPTKRSLAWRYRLATTLPAATRRQWVDLGRLLFADGGLLSDYVALPSVKHGNVAMNGFVVLSLIERHGPVSTSTLKSTLKPLWNPKTTQGRLDRLKAYKLIVEDATGWTTVPDFLLVLADYEERSGLQQLAVKQYLRHLRQRTEYRIMLAGGEAFIQRKLDVLSGPCIFCDATLATEVEHFPPMSYWKHLDPKLRHHPSLVFGACDWPGGDWPPQCGRLHRPVRADGGQARVEGRNVPEPEDHAARAPTSQACFRLRGRRRPSHCQPHGECARAQDGGDPEAVLGVDPRRSPAIPWSCQVLTDWRPHGSAIHTGSVHRSAPWGAPRPHLAARGLRQAFHTD